MRRRYEVEGRTVLLTGAANGIGADAARRLARRGANLALLDVDVNGLAALVDDLGSDRAAPFRCDVTDRADVEAAVAGARERFGRIDVAIANAGIATVGTVETIAYEDFERVIEVNLLGVWRTIRASLPDVIERGGYVLAVSSLAAAAHAPLMASYTAAKAGVEAFGDALRAELRSRGVAVGVAYFGFIDTDMVRNAFEHPAAAEARRRSPRLAMRSVPVGRAGAAIVRGIEQRSARVYAPRWIRPAIAAPGIVVQPVIDVAQRRIARRSIELADELARSD